MGDQLITKKGAGGILLVVAVFLILAWKVAGLIGLDRFVLPLLGTPWRGQPEAVSPAPATA